MLMKIDREEILKIARMSRIAVHEHEIEGYIKQLSAVLSYAQSVIQIAQDSDGEQISKNVNVFRKDEVSSSSPEKILKGAPEREENYFVVPRIVENR
jgi:aspartyl-tRNA(Asn)/glutamyl-tRNA(Gln) amidotransferase subunit C